ncbi:hypothetical protein ABER23_06720 [Paenibacillus lautus]|uniref:hypothetical protein n=1 Tax=Paenibacillus lautus TaxID=1401 RepID=UPI003D2D0817
MNAHTSVRFWKDKEENRHINFLIVAVLFLISFFIVINKQLVQRKILELQIVEHFLDNALLEQNKWMQPADSLRKKSFIEDIFHKLKDMEV